MSVVWPQLAAGLHLAHTGPDQGAADMFGDEGLLHPPARAVARLVPLIAVQVEALHRAEPTPGTGPVSPKSLRHNQPRGASAVLRRRPCPDRGARNRPRDDA